MLGGQKNGKGHIIQMIWVKGNIIFEMLLLIILSSLSMKAKKKFEFQKE